MLKKISISALVLSMSVGTAFAQEEDMAAPAPAEAASSGGGKNPTAYAKRGLTMAKGTVRIDYSNAGFGITDSPGITALGGGSRGLTLGYNGSDFSVAMGLGASVGLIENLEAGFLLVPLTLSPASGFGNMGFYGRYRFMAGSFELGGQVALTIPTEGGFGLSFGLPALIRLSDTMRLDTGVVVNLTLDPGTAVGLGVPLLLAFQISDPFWFGIRTGLNLGNFDAVGDTIGVPLGLAAGYTVAMNGAVSLLDITGEFTWTSFINSGHPDTIVPDVFAIILGANLYLDLF